MRLIYSRQAKSFLVEDPSLYRKNAATLVVHYAERMSHAVRCAPYDHRKAALNMAREHMILAWAQIHRTMRPFFFTDIEAVIARSECEPMELPDFSQNENIHSGLYMFLDVIEDLDRLTLLLRESGQEESSDLIFQNWNAVFRAANGAEGIARRIKSGKAFKGNT